VSCAKTAEPIKMPFGMWTYYMGVTLAPTGEYDQTVHVRQRCSLMSINFGHLFTFTVGYGRPME